MKRNDLKMFTQISFFIALATIIVLLLIILAENVVLDDNVVLIIEQLVKLTFLLSVFGIPLSIVSMFSKENLAKRIIALIVNLSPLGILVYGLFMEFIDEFLRGAP